MQALVSVTLLGGFRLDYAGSPVPVALSSRQQALLAYIFLHPAHPIARSQLAFLFWPDTSDQQAQTNLRSLLHRVRALLPWLNEILLLEGRSLSWKDSQLVTVDVLEFERFAGQAASTVELRQALQLYRGDFLPACYEDWVLKIRQKQHHLYLSLLESLADRLEASRQHKEALQVAYLLADESPLEEIHYHRLMRLHAVQGDLSAAFRTYKTCVDVLNRELGVPPSTETLTLLERLTASASSASADEADAVSKGNLPSALSRLVGRQVETEEIKRLLSTERLVTLTGYGGVGKTRLALNAARAASGQYPDGVWWVDLAPREDSSQVAASISAVFAPLAQSAATLEEQLVAFLSTKRLLLVVDNCEHVLPSLALLLNLLCQKCPNLSILATSRVSLRIPGEAVLTIPPLPVPHLAPQSLDLSLLNQNESIRLFIERGQAAQHSFEMDERNAPSIVQICRRLDGIPLAIELAASRLRLLTPQEIAARLDNILPVLARSSHGTPNRHRNMQSVLNWSFSLLDNSEQRVLRRMGLFAGSFNLAAFEAICLDPQVEASQALDTLAALVDQSLVEVFLSGDEARYRLHELTRQYCREKLHQAGEFDLLHARLLEYYAHLVSIADPQLHGPDQVHWLRRLDFESDNLYAALLWALRQPEAHTIQQALDLVGDLWFYWFYRGRYVDGLRWSEMALKTAQQTQLPASVQCKALNGAASFTYFMSEYQASAHYSTACLEASLQASYLDGVILSNHHLGLLAIQGMITGSAREYFSQGLDLARQTHTEWLETILLHDLSHEALSRDDQQSALSLYQDTLQIARRSGDLFGIYYALVNLAYMMILKNDLDGAHLYNKEALKIAQESGDVRGVGLCWLHEGEISSRTGDHNNALGSYANALDLLWDIRDRENVLECLLGIAKCSLEANCFELAARLLSACLSNIDQLHMSLPAEYKPMLDSARERLSQALGKNAYQSFMNSGALLSLEEAVQLARTQSNPESS